MTLLRYNRNFDELGNSSFSTMLDRFFNESVRSTALAQFTPQVDIAETEKHFEIELAVPGLKKEDIKINLEEGKLTISGERKLEKEEKGKNFHARETHYGAFSRSFYLPDTVNPEKIEAQYTDGILHVIVPKDEKKVTKRLIAVK
ncbi:Hsp20/alpha crystallin family protein [Cytophagales bacterium LB-30]|uniref:Hsp20/alpha crystallin family protein n=1 Tax=Shiella aurantiaca TaxID=3058365 RepID=A0ABT8F9K9_9BACT|nr:Hsp20/alpha crystallin family protein [Shiella aurantiaca]MDN4166886.1 Hsp20/alpha crystallin family protein [Shiella aurantiaca]